MRISATVYDVMNWIPLFKVLHLTSFNWKKIQPNISPFFSILPYLCKIFSAFFQVLVVEAEKFHCDTLGAMLKSLKNKKVIEFDQNFLMYPMHKEEIVTLKKADYDPFSAGHQWQVLLVMESFDQQITIKNVCLCIVLSPLSWGLKWNKVVIERCLGFL